MVLTLICQGNTITRTCNGWTTRRTMGGYVGVKLGMPGQVNDVILVWCKALRNA